MTVPLRSVLFVPAGNARALETSFALGADALIHDLEDSVAPGERGAAREALRAHLAVQPRFPGPRIVRINALDTEWGTEDLLAARACLADAILLPKVDGPADIEAAARALAETDAPDAMRLWAMIETARGLDAVRETAKAAPGRLAALVVGPDDLALDTGIAPGEGRAELVPWLMEIVLAAKANGLAVLDGAFSAFRDAEGFDAECRQGARMGFSGKTLIHPSQIPGANEAFTPSTDEIERARAVVAAYARPENAARGAIALDGRMVERLHLEAAERLLQLQESIERLRREA